MRFNLAIRPFFAGLVLGLIALATAGAVLRPSSLTNGFTRIHGGLNSRNFFATAREIKSIIDAIPQDKMVVIVGGTSVLQGTSQSEPYVWTNYLQANLGPTFKVINFALRSGRPNDFGNLAAEMLLREHRKVIYVCDSMIAQFTIPPEASFYQQTVFDAWRRGYLLPWPPRDKLMNNALWSNSPQLQDAAWGSLVDLPLNFKDLWNYFSFEIKGSVWNSISRTASFDPLRSVLDPEPAPDWYKARGYPVEADDVRELQKAAQQLMPQDDPRWLSIKTSAEEQFPPALRAITLINVDINSPFYLDRIPNGRNKYLNQAQHMADLLMGIGFPRTLVAERAFDANDFSDRVHLAVSGGVKLAANVAPEVRALAATLRYIQ